MSTEEAPPAAASEQVYDARELGRTLIDRFGGGWAKSDIDLLTSVFAPEATFVETPFSEPIRGANAIRRWWLDVPYSQSEISFTSGEIYSAGPWFSTEFKCVFRRKRTGEWVDARGAIFCETAGGLISEMRMYWHRWNGGRETSKP
ncbi:MAG TPA: nuclear transport factor 2 family protein [Gemmatimonadales bacterium]|nr:nuclear transport factor 2 family protein [Gemmatimonadales bacterium]